MKRTLTKKDRLILDKILLYVCSDNSTEDECAKFVNRETEGEISRATFSNWLSKFPILSKEK